MRQNISRKCKNLDAEEGGRDERGEEKPAIPLQDMKDECLFVGDWCRQMRLSHLIAGCTLGA
jgi:hypothetical protein